MQPAQQRIFCGSPSVRPVKKDALLRRLHGNLLDVYKRQVYADVPGAEGDG